MGSSKGGINLPRGGVAAGGGRNQPAAGGGLWGGGVGGEKGVAGRGDPDYSLPRVSVGGTR